jgi:hypothetical protein
MPRAEVRGPVAMGIQSHPAAMKALVVVRSAVAVVVVV